MGCMDQDGDGRESPPLCLREDGLTVEPGWLENESGSQELKQQREVGAQDDAGATLEETVWGEPDVGSSVVFPQGGGWWWGGCKKQGLETAYL